MNVTCLGSRMNKHNNNHKQNLAPPHNLKQTKHNINILLTKILRHKQYINMYACYAMNKVAQNFTTTLNTNMIVF